MTAAHLLFAIALTVYILVAIKYEERDLTQIHNEYADYSRRVPMLVPAGPLSRPAASGTKLTFNSGIERPIGGDGASDT